MQRNGAVRVLVLGGEWGLRGEVLRAMQACSATPVQREHEVVIVPVRGTQAERLAEVQRAVSENPETPVIAVGVRDDPREQAALQAAKVYECLSWPVEVTRLAPTLRRAAEWRAMAIENQSLRRELARSLRPAREALILGNSPAMRDLDRVVVQIAPTGAAVLIVGEEGSGKELVAKTIHEHSGRIGAFVSARCRGRGGAEFNRVLFGDDARAGLIEGAHRGTLFLDDIEALNGPGQAQLLRVIEDRAVWRRGASCPVDLRLVTATGNDLNAECDEGSFREDLLARLQVVTIQVPPLAARREDIPSLVEHLVQHFAMVLGKPAPALAPEALELLLRHPWPGNIQQLAQTIDRAVLHARGEFILREDLDLALTDDAGAEPEAPWLTLAEVEREYIDRVLSHTRGNKTRAAELLGIDRRTLSRLFARERAELSARA